MQCKWSNKSIIFNDTNTKFEITKVSIIILYVKPYNRKKTCTPLADPTVQFVQFSWSFRQKICQIIGWRPPLGTPALLGNTGFTTAHYRMYVTFLSYVFLLKVPNSAILASGTKLAEKTYWMNKGKEAETTFSKVAKLHEK